ncbi:2,3-diaminopropionate biosynthesis protein SbnB [Dactylosporangium sp. NBC_01737]|jgi:2,3-diaminopropionate biosynthesis protein SbnB|uniref:2,3-diaminopropionate biosynthesis protein SbnB n=1 Tax=Dactylosporangium sp. NBC_01737 TaxID=2975959 RepID=UPI002E0EE6FD|nr:2,3-diaminopropionate biosynthesis protein SbnB [Dactylosporangium sp. NBC_01737]
MLILGRRDVKAVLDGADGAVLRTVRDTYVAHARGETSVPHSVFLRFPDDDRNRIIGLPAYVGGARPVAAMKWIASFPGNIGHGLERASAAILLNRVDDGRPVALVEGSVISARRTAASAAVAAEELTVGAPDDVRTGVTLIGCGVINAEVLRFLRAKLPAVADVALFDLDAGRARAFADRIRRPDLRVEVHERIDTALAAHRIVSLATTAGTPHLTTAACRPGTVVLHLSLRDLAPESILVATNVVDDADHVCRAATSCELAEQRSGGRDFIAAELGAVLARRATVPYDPHAVTVFSPFGLGILDAAVAAHVLDTAASRGLGTHLPDFLTD